MGTPLDAFYGLTILQILIICGVLCLTCSFLINNILMGVFFVGCWFCGKNLATGIVKRSSYFNSVWVLTLIEFIKGVHTPVKHFIATFIDRKDDLVCTNSFKQCKESNRPPSEPNDEASIMQSYIIRDFIISWFSTISDDDQCIHKAREILETLTRLAFDRMMTVDKYVVVKNYAHLYQCHLAEYQAARLKLKQQPKVRRKMDPSKKEFSKMTDVADAFYHMRKFHIALKDPDTENQYLRALTESVLRVLLPPDLYDCYTGRELLIEILTCNIIVKIVDLIQNPFWLHKILIQVLSDDRIILIDKPTTGKLGKSSIHKLEPDTAFSKRENEMTFKASSNTTLQIGAAEKPRNLKVPKHSNMKEKKKSSIEEIQEATSLLIFPEASDGQVPSKESKIKTSVHPWTENHDTYHKEPSKEFSGLDLQRLVPRKPHFFLEESETISIQSESTNSTNSDQLPEREGPDGASFIPESAVYSDNPECSVNCQQSNEEKFTAESPKIVNASEIRYRECSHGEPTFHSATTHCNQEPANCNIHGQSGNVISSVSNQTGWSSSEPNLVITQARRTDSISVDDADDAYSELEGAVHKRPELLFAEIFVTGTENRKETSGLGTGTYTLYIIEALSWHETSVSSWQLTSQIVKRRYREFLTLQERLEEHPKYNKTMKNVKGPSRWKSLPFGNMESKMVDRRKVFLQNYLQTLSAYPDLGNSMALREFLAYDGDASIAFVTKAPEMPRPDKVLVKTVSGVFKKISSALPKVDDDKAPPFAGVNGRDHQQRQVMGLDSNDWNDADNLSIQFEESDQDDEEDVIEQVYSRCVSSRDGVRPGSDSPVSDGEFHDALEVKITPSLHRLDGDGCDITSLRQGTSPPDLTPLTSTILDLAEQSIIARDTWIRKEKVLHVFKVLLARALESWFKNEVDDASTKERCAYYIRLLTDTLWPDGELDDETIEEPSDLQKITTKEQARDILEKFFPSFIPLIVGDSDFQHSLDQIMASLDHPKLNRHFAFCLLDLLVESFLPEINTANIHKQLLQPNTHEK